MARVTRSAAKGKVLSIPSIPSDLAIKDISNSTHALKEKAVPSPIQTPRPNIKWKRSHEPRVLKEPVSGGWDVLPHWLGKKGDLEDATEDNKKHPSTKVPEPPKKRAKREKLEVIKAEDIGDPITTELLKDDLLKNNGRELGASKNEGGDEVKTESKEEDYEDVKPKRKRATTHMKTALETTEDVLKKVDDLIETSEKAPKPKKQKKNTYSLTPGLSPFPGFVMPTPEACEEVTRLLSELHGEVKAPEVIPPPSLEVTGCGEVPDLLDALIRTLLSASTNSTNANMSLKGLKDTFGLRESGIGKGSVDWEVVQKAEPETIVEAIKKGGLAKVKGNNIKRILDLVYNRNQSRLDALLNTESKETIALEQKNLEIARYKENILSMDHIFEMSTEEAMNELTKFPGIGVKTSSCVILFCMKRPSFAVDTHVWRHCKWLGWVPPKATRDQTFSHCEVRIPDHLKYPLHYLFIRHGKTCGRCRADTSAGSEVFDGADCPIEHLVSRTEAKKIAGGGNLKKSKAGGKKVSNAKGGRGRKGKMVSETDESDAEMTDLVSDPELGRGSLGGGGDN